MVQPWKKLLLVLLVLLLVLLVDSLCSCSRALCFLVALGNTLTAYRAPSCRRLAS